MYEVHTISYIRQAFGLGANLQSGYAFGVATFVVIWKGFTQRSMLMQTKGNAKEMSHKEVLELNISKNWKGYEAFLFLVIMLEGFMMIYGLLHFDLHDMRRKLYFASYVFLFVYTIVTLLINRIYMTKIKNSRIGLVNACIYNVVLIFWSALISALDILGGGYAVTYMTILAAIGSMIAIRPLLYGCAAIFSSMGMITVVKCLGDTSLHIPFFLNHMIFLLVIIAVQNRNFRATKSQYIANKQLEEWAGIDGLTQIANRRSLDGYMEQLLKEEQLFSFVLLDVDNFKSINDTYGHQEGDYSLIEIANTLVELFGEHVFRYGGDEFAIVSFESAETVAKKLETVNQRLKIRNTSYQLQTCAGVYQNKETDDERKIFELADAALYHAKHQGKARAVIYTDELL
ncbi:MAG: GGDEF domain-containing protein [Lachnospiraceae bacterium]